MQRENFKITSTTGLTVIKHKWNAACREVEALVKAIANDEKTTYRLIDSNSLKSDFGHIKGHRTWQSDAGKTVVFTIEKQA